MQSLVVVVAVHQSATDSKGRALQVGDRLPAGTAFATGAGGRLTLVTRHGSEFTLDAKSGIAISRDGRSADLRAGRLYCRNREHEFAAISTAAGKIELLGTVVGAAIKGTQSVAVTVVEGKVRLANAHGEAVVSAGRKALLVAQLPPEEGTVTDVATETAWYDGRRIISDYGEIAYAVFRGDQNITEIWVMNADGTGKHKVKAYIGGASLGPWLPGQQVLLVQPAGLLWTYPDFTQQRADTNSGAPMVEPWITWWLLDAATGQDVSITVPAEYQAFHMALSPDATMIAFGGTRRSNPTDPKSWEAGTWLYDLHTGVITRLLDESIDSPPAWSPDGRRLALPAGGVWSGDYRLRLVVVDVETRSVADLNVAGTDPCFSPDGARLAYVAGITGHHTSRDQGKIFVLDLAAGAQPRQISPGPEGWGSSSPQWSADGTRVFYTVQGLADRRNDWILKVAAADGSGSREVYRGMFWQAAWNRAGDALYVQDLKKGMLLVAADGSGVIADLGGNEDESPLSPAEKANFQAAQTTLRQAVFQHAMGNRDAYYGQMAEAKASHRNSAQLFAEMPWRYPYLGLSLTNALIYADAEQAMADESTSQMLLATCKQRLSHAAYLVAAYYRKTGKYALDLAAVETWAKALPLTTMNDVIRLDRDDTSVIFRCPQGDLFTYTQPAPGTEPNEGDVMLTCPNHPDCKATWKKWGDSWGADTPSGWRVTNGPG
jgi:hypothetical protein